MSEVNHFAEAAFTLMFLMIPVGAIGLLFVAAHIVGGAFKPGHRNDHQIDPEATSTQVSTSISDIVTTGRVDTPKTNVA
jgi:hypothetical protein